MKIDRYQIPKSSFLSMEKDMGIIMEQMEKSNRLKKLLWYTTKDALEKPNIDKSMADFVEEGIIKLVPKVSVDGSVLNYVIINFDSFSPNATNPEFRDNLVQFDIICHFDQWNLGDFRLRPYKIAAEIDSLFDGEKLTGIGTLQFAQANQLILNDEFAGITLTYYAIHGEEDKRPMPNAEQQQALEEDLKDLLNLE